MKIPNEMYVELYSSLAEKMLVIRYALDSDFIQLYQTDDNGDERFTDKAQFLFDMYCEKVLAVLEDVGIEQEGVS